MAEEQKQQKEKKIQKKWEKYSVEGDRVVRNRRSCPKCGSGVFLAEHKDRFSCGLCGYMEKKTGQSTAPAERPRPETGQSPEEPHQPKAEPEQAPAEAEPTGEAEREKSEAPEEKPEEPKKEESAELEK